MRFSIKITIFTIVVFTVFTLILSSIYERKEVQIIDAVGLDKDRVYIIEDEAPLAIKLIMSYDDVTAWVWSSPLFEGIRNDEIGNPQNLDQIALRTKNQLTSEGRLIIYSDRIMSVDGGKNNLLIILKGQGEKCAVILRYTEFP